MIALLPLLPLLTGLVLWSTDLLAPARRPSGRVLGGIAVVTLTATTALAAVVVASSSVAVHDLGGGLQVVLSLDPAASVMAVLVPAIAAIVVAWAAVHEGGDGLSRLLGLLTGFVGTMLMVVTAADLLLLTVGWELVAIVSWALIGHGWRDASRPARAAHAFHATRFGALGLFVAAGALFADTGSLTFAAVGDATPSTRGIVAAGVVIAAVAKSGQLPFSSWLFSAMAGPTPASALLHSATMVAAGAFTLARLEPQLASVSWFRPTLITVGLATALAGGLVAAVQDHAKKLLAGSTSANYGLMLVAIGAGHPEVAMLHLVAHALFKSQLFLSAGVAIAAVGSERLDRMRVGSHLPRVAAFTLVGALALAAVPPLGGGWTKEEVLASGTSVGVPIGVFVAVAGALSAFYAARFYLLAYGRHRGGDPSQRQLVHRPGGVEVAAIGVLAAGSIGLGVLWVPSLHDRAARFLGTSLPEGHLWEVVLSLFLVALSASFAYALDRRGSLASIAVSPFGKAVGTWFGLEAATKRLVVDPVLWLSQTVARFDDRVVDRGVSLAAATADRLSRGLSGAGERGVDGVVSAVAASGGRLAELSAGAAERGVEAVVGGIAQATKRAADDMRRIQTGFVHHQFVVIVIGVAALLIAAAVGKA